MAFSGKQASTTCATAHMLFHCSWQPTGEDQTTDCTTRFIRLSLRQHQMTFL